MLYFDRHLIHLIMLWLQFNVILSISVMSHWCQLQHYCDVRSETLTFDNHCNKVELMFMPNIVVRPDYNIRAILCEHCVIFGPHNWKQTKLQHSDNVTQTFGKCWCPTLKSLPKCSLNVGAHIEMWPGYNIQVMLPEHCGDLGAQNHNWPNCNVRETFCECCTYVGVQHCTQLSSNQKGTACSTYFVAPHFCRYLSDFCT